ncbi:aldose epimerase family protein [Burkholderia sp. MR1-5-21]
MSTRSRLILDNRVLRAELAPGLGARLTRLQVVACGTDIVVPLHEWTAPPHSWPKAGAYPLIPYSNRIAGAQLRFGDMVHALPPHPLDLPNTLHGIAHRCEWETRAFSDVSAEFALHYAGAHWPWPFDARIAFRLDGPALHVELAVCNAGASAMPAGVGWHPFLARDAHASIRFDARRRWHIDAACVPNGNTSSTHEAIRIDERDWQSSDVAIYASEWHGPAVVTRANGRIAIDAAAPLDHLVAFVPRGAPYLCVEPVSHVANAFNLAAAGVAHTGMRVLGPGESLSAHTSLRWEARANR